MSADEITKLWESVDKRDLVQYKLKVELQPEVLTYIGGQKGEATTTASQSEKKGNELF